MKKLLALILAGAMTLSLAACGGENKKEETETYTAVQIRDEMAENELKDKLSEEVGEFTPGSILYVDTLNEALMALKSEKATGFMTTEATALYVAARDSELDGMSHTKLHPEFPHPTLHIVALPSSSELIDKINTAIKAMKEDGTMDKLYTDYVTAVIDNGEPATLEIPTFEGAETITIGISGDLPPMDYVNADGVPTGFNVAVIAEIAKRLQINIKTEIVASGTRFMALESKRIDAFFWEIGVETKESNYLLSDAYAEMPGGLVIKKGQKPLNTAD